MASIRKRYRDEGLELEKPDDDDDEHDGEDTPAPREPTMEPVEHRAQLQPQQPQQTTPQTVEHAIAYSGLPAVAKDWLRRHPEYVSDKDKSQEINKYHETAKYLAGGEQFTQKYLDRMEEVLGMRQMEAAPAPRANGGIPPPNPSPQRQVQQPTVQQPRQQAQPQYRGVPPSAPPTRSAPSMTTGRPAASPMQLSGEEMEVVQSMQKSCPTWSLEECRKRYLEGKTVMMKRKASGEIQ